MDKTIYIDHNATTPPLPEVIAAVCEAMGLIGANPSSIHANGRAARKLIDDAAIPLPPWSARTRKRSYSPAAVRSPTIR